MKTWPRSSRRLTCGPENALASRPQISYSYSSTSLLRWQVESAQLINVNISGFKEKNMTIILSSLGFGIFTSAWGVQDV